MDMKKMLETNGGGLDCEGPFGFPMNSAVAKEIESICKTLPKECKDGYGRLTVAPQIEFVNSDTEMADISKITSNAIHRSGRAYDMKGLNWTQFNKSPLVFFNHKHDDLPVGRALWIQPYQEGNKEGFKAKTRYTPKPENYEGNWYPEVIHHFVKNGDLPGKSIGVLPTKFRTPSKAELKANPEMMDLREPITAEGIVLEYSVVGIGNNPEALKESLEKALTEGLPTIPEPNNVITEDQYKQRVIQTIKSEVARIAPAINNNIISAEEYKKMKLDALHDSLNKKEISKAISRAIRAHKGRLW